MTHNGSPEPVPVDRIYQLLILIHRASEESMRHMALARTFLAASAAPKLVIARGDAANGLQVKDAQANHRQAAAECDQVMRAHMNDLLVHVDHLRRTLSPSTG